MDSIKLACIPVRNMNFPLLGNIVQGHILLRKGRYFRTAEIKKQTDYVICLYHGGVEFYPYPTPEMQARLRRYIYAGADLVVSQHSHCIGCTENIMAENWFMDREIFSLASDRRSKKIFRIRMHGKEGWYCKLIRKRNM